MCVGQLPAALAASQGRGVRVQSFWSRLRNLRSWLKGFKYALDVAYWPQDWCATLARVSCLDLQSLSLLSALYQLHDTTSVFAGLANPYGRWTDGCSAAGKSEVCQTTRRTS